MECRERDTEWYDNSYSKQLLKGGQYSLDPEQTVYTTLWKKTLEWISDAERIIDFGCGVGQFAELCLRNNKRYVWGCDFSQVAIDEAHRRNPEISHLLRLKDLRDPLTFNFIYYDVAVLLEVLEHIEFDVEVIGHIPSGKRILLSVPNYMTGAHVRCFSNGPEIHARFGHLITMVHIARIKMTSAKCIWLCDCIRR